MPSQPVRLSQGDTEGCHRTFAKITENLRVHAVSPKMNTKRDRMFRKRKMKQEKIENNGKRETDRRRTDRAKNYGKLVSLDTHFIAHSLLQETQQQQMLKQYSPLASGRSRNNNMVLDRFMPQQHAVYLRDFEAPFEKKYLPMIQTFQLAAFLHRKLRA